MPSIYASWVHGSAVTLERNVQPSKDGVNTGFRGKKEYDGDVVELGNWGMLAVGRFGWGARFVVFDSGTGDEPKSGTSNVTYAVPTPVIVSGNRARFNQVWVRTRSSSHSNLRFNNMQVWDGEEALIKPNGWSTWGTVGDIRIPLNNEDVNWGVAVSLNLEALNAKNMHLDVFSVGIDFIV